MPMYSFKLDDMIINLTRNRMYRICHNILVVYILVAVYNQII